MQGEVASSGQEGRPRVWTDPPNGKGWVDHIRKKGNEAAHEIVLMTKADADELIVFSEMLLKFVYEFPNRVPT